MSKVIALLLCSLALALAQCTGGSTGTCTGCRGAGSCGWCTLNAGGAACYPGDQLGPFGGNTCSGTWYKPGSTPTCPAPAANCGQYSTCSTCKAGDSRCHWCGDGQSGGCTDNAGGTTCATGYTLVMGGSTSNDTCPLQCPSSTDGCAACVGFSGNKFCGFCVGTVPGGFGPSSSCQVGNSAGPRNGACDVSWTPYGNSSTCPGNPGGNMCGSVDAQSCGPCTNFPGCGWCLQDFGGGFSGGSCRPGVTSGPVVGTCIGANNQSAWYFAGRASCPGNSGFSTQPHLFIVALLLIIVAAF